MSHVLSEPDSAFPTRSETKLAVTPLKMGLGFEISDLNRKQRDCTIYVAKAKAQINCAGNPHS